MHVYASHLDGFFTTEEKLSFDEEICEQCGDVDWYLGEAETEEEAENLYDKHMGHIYD